MKFIEGAEGDWLALVSFIKPHWPYIVPAPHHDMFGPNHVPAQRHDAERDDPHPVFGAFMNNRFAAAFQQDIVREKVIPACTGLVKQADDQFGALFDWLGETGRLDDTMIGSPPTTAITSATTGSARRTCSMSPAQRSR